ncbi:MAG: VPLPA-CTERM sorting domain-containing protein [Pseudomonadota bacterium]
MLKKVLATVGVTALAHAASANMISGSLENTDPTWDGCGSGAATGCFYDVVEFTVDADGLYTFDAFYPGDTGLDENLDGVLEIYEGSFDPLAPGGIAFDDDGPGGSNTSQILDVDLDAGVTYFAVISSFSNAPTSFGQATGDWELSASGAGNVTFVPVPAAVWMMLSALGALGFTRRRRA